MFTYYCIAPAALDTEYRFVYNMISPGPAGSKNEDEDLTVSSAGDAASSDKSRSGREMRVKRCKKDKKEKDTTKVVNLDTYGLTGEHTGLLKAMQDMMLMNVGGLKTELKTDIKALRQDVKKESEERKLDIANIKQELEKMKNDDAVSMASTAPMHGFATSSPKVWPLPSYRAQSIPTPFGRRITEKPPGKDVVIIGGWAYDTKKDIIEGQARIMLKDIPNIKDVWCPTKRCSICKVRFESTDRMWTWVRSMKGKKLKRKENGAEVDHWFSVEKDPHEAAMSKVTSKAMRLLVALGVDRDKIDADYRKASVWVSDVRLIATNKDSGQVTVDAEAFLKLKISGELAVLQRDLNDMS